MTLGRNFHWEDKNWSNLPASTSSKAPHGTGSFCGPHYVGRFAEWDRTIFSSFIFHLFQHGSTVLIKRWHLFSTSEATVSAWRIPRDNSQAPQIAGLQRIQHLPISGQRVGSTFRKNAEKKQQIQWMSPIWWAFQRTFERGPKGRTGTQRSNTNVKLFFTPKGIYTLILSLRMLTKRAGQSNLTQRMGYRITPFSGTLIKVVYIYNGYPL